MSYYAVYKDDTLITHGTTLEIAEVLGVSIPYVYSAASRWRGNDRPGKQLLIKVEEDNDGMDKHSLNDHAPKIDRSKWTNTITRKKKPREVHPAPNHKATDTYLKMMFRGWRR